MFTGFLNASSPIGGAEVPSFLSLHDEADSQADLHGILEKQIEEISRLADGSKDFPKDSPLEIKRVNQVRGKHKKPLISSNVSSHSSQDNFRRSTRSQTKQHVEVEFNKDLQEDKSCVNHPKKYLEDKTFLGPPKKDSEEERPFLSPLAARAAFASLIHETPVKAELSASYVVGKEDHQNLIPKDSTDYVEVRRHNFKCEYIKSGNSFEDGLPSVTNPIQDTDSDTSVASQGASRRSSCKGARQKTKLKKSLYKAESFHESLHTSEETKCGKLSGLTIVNNSTVCGKLSGRAITTRLTRSSVQKEITGPSDELKNGASNEKIISPMNIVRVTRSRKQLENSNSGAKQELKKSELTKDTHDRPKVTSPVSTRVTRSSKQIEKSNTDVNQDPKKIDQAQDTHDEPEAIKPVNITSVTCSSKQIETSKPNVKQEAKKSAKAQDNRDLPEDLATPNNNERKNKTVNSSEDPIDELPQKVKRTRASSRSSSTKADSGEIQGDESAPSKKKKTGNKDILSKKPEQRFSPRLKLLPRTS